MKKSLVALSIIICAFVAGMLLCVFFAAFDNFLAEGSPLDLTMRFVVFFVLMLFFFIIGAGIWGYESMSTYFIHNTIFYLLFAAIIVTVMAAYIKRRKLCT